MRLIRKKLGDKVVKLLASITKELGVEDPGFTSDVFCLFVHNGRGIPSPERLAALIKATAASSKMSQVSLRIVINKRAQVLKDLIQTSYFTSLASSSTSSMDCVRRLLLNLRKLYLKSREAQCITCQYLNQCDFGKQYSNAVRSINQVIDPDWELKVHSNCPSLPQIAFTNQISAGAAQLLALAAGAKSGGGVKGNEAGDVANAQANMPEPPEEDENEEENLSTEDEVEEEPDDSEDSALDDDIGRPAGGHGKTDSYDVKFRGSAVWKINENLIDKITKQDLILFELGQRLSLQLGAQKAGKFAPVPNVAKDTSSTEIKSLSDLPKIDASQHALPTKLFDAKLQKKTLTKVQNLQPEEKKRLLYILLDGSASMNDSLGGTSTSNLGLQSKSQLATVLCCAFIRRVRDDKGMVFVRIFGSTPGPLIRAKELSEFEGLLTKIQMCDFNSGTDISAALNTAAKDIHKSMHEIADPELLLITDCEDDLDETWIKTTLGKTELSVLDARGSQYGGGFSGGSAALKGAATKYFKCNEQAVTIQNLVELL